MIERPSSSWSASVMSWLNGVLPPRCSGKQVPLTRTAATESQAPTCSKTRFPRQPQGISGSRRLYHSASHLRKLLANGEHVSFAAERCWLVSCERAPELAACKQNGTTMFPSHASGGSVSVEGRIANCQVPFRFSHSASRRWKIGFGCSCRGKPILRAWRGRSALKSLGILEQLPEQHQNI